MIWEGLKNRIFKTEHVEAIYEERFNICRVCENLDTTGEGCHVQATAPCCNKNTGGCGCSLALKLRSLSSSCPIKKWEAVVNEQEEEMIRQQILNNRLNDTQDTR